MSIRAYGNNAAIELFEHHLVITHRQPGFIVDGPAAEQFIPFSSIRSVQFVRPGFFSLGRIVFTLSGGSSPHAGECAVLFPKAQVRQFEDVLHSVRQAIATPLIERIAMAAAQNRGRIEQGSPPMSASQSDVVVSHPDGESYNTGPRYQPAGGYDDRSYVPPQPHRPINPTLGGWWHDMPVLGKIIVIAFACFLTLAMCSAIISSPTTDDEGAAASTDESAASTLSADQMLSEWSEFVTGQASTSGIAITDGAGKPGEFCSATTGETIMTFGGKKLGPELPEVYDFFGKFTTGDDSGYIGAFWFERASGKLQALRMVHKQHADAESQQAGDFTMAVTQVSPGIVSLDGVAYHSCVI